MACRRLPRKGRGAPSCRGARARMEGLGVERGDGARPLSAVRRPYAACQPWGAHVALVEGREGTREYVQENQADEGLGFREGTREYVQENQANEGGGREGSK
eukprot:361422-Chlamydomonas_euryale.AAC.1